MTENKELDAYDVVRKLVKYKNIIDTTKDPKKCDFHKIQSIINKVCLMEDFDSEKNIKSFEKLKSNLVPNIEKYIEVYKEYNRLYDQVQSDISDGFYAQLS